MLLIDALYINQGGGLRLLVYLVSSLKNRSVNFHLLADKRCEGMFDYLSQVEYVEASMLNRYYYYKAHQNTYSKVLCFGNVPPPIKLTIAVYTYFQNINLLKIEGYDTLKRRTYAWLKRIIIKSLKKNTDLWIVQTKNTSDELERHLHEKKSRIKVLPFFDLPEIINNNFQRTDYVYISRFNRGNKGFKELIDAWKILQERGINVKLHLTIDKNEEKVKEIEKRCDLENLNIVNHGTIPFENVLGLYEKSKAIVYPSRNESLGLGIIEAIKCGCDVIGPDLSYIYTICNPSEVFNQASPSSIADAVGRYEMGNSPKSILLVNNKISDLIEILQS